MPSTKDDLVTAIACPKSGGLVLRDGGKQRIADGQRDAIWGRAGLYLSETIHDSAPRRPACQLVSVTAALCRRWNWCPAGPTYPSPGTTCSATATW
jgi:hypothetical protein